VDPQWWGSLWSGWSAEVLDDADEFVGAVALAACELDEFACAGDDRAAFRGAGDGHAASASELEQPFVAQDA
jgi:hypothetical protein